jgi:acetyl esterase/lipase
MTIPSASGRDELPVLILRPRGVHGPLSCIYYTANGAKMQQSSRVAVTDYEPQLVNELDVDFISILPRVGPAHPHPAQVEDVYAGLMLIAENCERLNVDPARIMVAGKSGGGGIAAATALYARDQGGPAINHQILIYPMLDDRAVTVSSAYDVAPWTADNKRVGWSSILGESAAGADVSPDAAAARATNLVGLPATYVEVGSREVFRDEDLEYALRLAQAGVPVEIHSWQGGFHAFEFGGPEANMSRACHAARTSYFQRALYATAT